MPLVNMVQNDHRTLLDGIANLTLTEIKKNDFPTLSFVRAYFFSNFGFLTSVNFPKATGIFEYAFYGCVKLSNIIIPEATYIRVQSMFKCVALKNLALPKIQTVGNQAFMSCNGLLEVSMGSAITSISTTAFQDCTQSGLTITINRSQDAVSGSPWGATNATVVWSGTT